MKNYLRYFILSILYLFTLVSISAQNELSTQGTSFWVAFMKNYHDGLGGAWNLKLVISAKKACSGMIVNPNTNWSRTFTVGDKGITEIVIPLQYIEQAYVYENEVVTAKSLYVTSTDTISLFASNYLSHSYDVTNILPEPILGDEYIIQTYPSSYLSSVSPEFLVIATEDNTIVDIRPTSLTSTGRPANNNFSIRLNRGESYMVSAVDLSGTVIKSRDAKKLAVFNGSGCANVPIHCGNCDHLYEQAFPVNMWGRQFVLVNSIERDFDVIRVTAKEDGTELYLDDIFLVKINCGETFEFDIYESDALYEYESSARFLKTSKPSMVYLYLTGHTCNIKSGYLGDPSMVIVSPIEQQIDEITFGVFDTYNIKKHKVNIVTYSSQVKNMKLDGVDISSDFYKVEGNPKLSYARIDINAGTHTLENAYGFTAYAYGISDESLRESYAYSLGSSARNLNIQMYVNEVPHNLIKITDEFCKDERNYFECAVNYIPYSVQWHFDNKDIQTGDTTSYIFDTYGLHTVEMIVAREEFNPYRLEYDTVSVEINITNKERIMEIECVPIPYYFNDIEFTKSGTYFINIPQEDGCDSIMVLNLSLSSKLKVQLREMPYICAGDNKFLLPYETIDGFTSCGVVFDERAIQAGFKNLENISYNPQEEIEIKIPEFIIPNIYSGTLYFYDICSGNDTVPFSFMVRYPVSIMEQKWNDVITLLKSDYNDGYVFTDYQWYKNDIPIPEADHSYLYLSEGLDTDAHYSVEVTRASDNVKLFSCPYTPEERIIEGIYPVLAYLDQYITIDINQKGKGYLWDITGKKISEYHLTSGENFLVAPQLAGVYILVIETEVQKYEYTLIIK